MNKDVEEFERWWNSFINFYDQDEKKFLPRYKGFFEDGFQAGLAAGRAEAKGLVEALEKISEEGVYPEPSSFSTSLQLARQALAAWEAKK